MLDLSLYTTETKTRMANNTSKSMARLIFWFWLSLLSGHEIIGQTANVLEGCAPLTVEFSAPALSDYFWDFDDRGTSSNLQNPSHVFPSAGTYLVELREGTNGSVAGQIEISVYNKPQLNFVGDPTDGCAPLAVIFNDQTSYESPVVPEELLWTFGDGGSSSDIEPTHTYLDQGQYSVALQIQTNFPSCDTTVLRNNYINVGERLETDFEILPSSFSCDAPFTVSFNNLSETGPGISYSWDFGNGQSSMDFDPGSITYTNSGDYTIRLTVTSSSANCSNVVTKQLSISRPSLAVSFGDTLCLEQLNTMNSLVPNAQYQWDFGPDAMPMTSTTRTNNVTFQRSGLHTISFTITSEDGACSADTTFTVYVQDVDVSFTKDPSFACELPKTFSYSANGQSGTFRWEFPEGQNLFGRDVSRIVESPDTNYYHQVGPFEEMGRLIVRSSAGCLADTSFTDSLLLPFAVLLVDDSDGCAPHEVEFDFFTQSREDIIRYTLYFGNGDSVNLNSDDPYVYTYNNEGEYESFVIIENSSGCLDTSVITRIDVGVPINVDFVADRTEVCQNEVVQFTASPQDPRIDQWHYRAEGDQITDCDDQGNTEWLFNDVSGPIDVTLIVEYNGCFTEIEKENYIQMNGPIAQFEYTIDCANPFVVNITNTSQNADSYNWFQFGSDPTYQNENFQFEYTETGDYNITLRANNPSSGCPPSFANEEIFIREIDAEIQIRDADFNLQDEPFKLCGGEDYILDGFTNSQDVVESCRKGYTWYFSESMNRRDLQLEAFGLDSRIHLPDSGNHQIILQVEDINGCKDRDTINLSTYSQYPEFIANEEEVCLPAELSFTSLSTADTTIAQLEFLFQDGTSIEDSIVTRSFIDDQSDSLLITHIVTDVLGCKDTLDRIIDVYEPVTEISFRRFRRVCVDEVIEVSATDFTDKGSFLLYDWQIQDPINTSFDSSAFEISFSEEGQYYLDLIIQEEATGCTTAYRDTFFIQDYPDAGFSTNVDTASVLCNPTTILFQDTSVSNHNLDLEWYIQDVLELEGEQEEVVNPGFTFEKGTWQVILVAETGNRCRDTSQIRIFEVVGPEGVALPDSALLCLGDTILFDLRDTVDVTGFTWDFGDGNTVSDMAPIEHSYNFYPQDGRTTATLTLSGAEGQCKSVKSVPIRIYDVVAEFRRNNGVDTALCLGSYPFFATSDNVNMYQWDFGDGSTNSGDSVIHVYQDPGLYDVSLFVRNDTVGCSDSTSKTVLLYPLPEPEGMGDTICLGDTAVISVLNPNAQSFYNWLEDPDLISDMSLTATVLSNESRYFTLLEEDSLGCVGADSVFVSVIQPVQGMNWDTSIVIGDTAFLPVPFNSLFTYDWMPEDGLSCLNCSNPYIQIFEDAFYRLILGDVRDCFQAPFNFNIEVIDEEKIRVPNTFSPDGNGVNDLVFVEGWAIKELLSFRIFNRWGEKVFDTNNMNFGWDGRYEGKLQNPDVYFYQVEAISWRSDRIIYQEGEIELVR